ncbi:porin family protein [Falsiporphyromonas endometrii]|uniref:Porin family protein n=1 Tax=Falsiporphyromonas endometrii TaxID=1387297 RepID=A0ABV9K794_9PORP
MKRSVRYLLLIIVATIIAVTNLNAQPKPPYQPKLFVGLSGGVSMSRLAYHPKVSLDSYIGYMGGIMARAEVESFAGVQLEVNYSQRGWKEYFEPDREGNPAYQMQLKWIDIPLMSNLFLRAGRFRFFLNMGPQISFMLNNQASIEGEGFNKTEIKRHNLEVKGKFGWGLVGGPGISFDMGKLGLIELEGRFNYAFNDIFSNTAKDPYDKSSEMVGTLKINYLYKF